MYAVEEAGVVRAHGDGLSNGHVGTKATFKVRMLRRNSPKGASKFFVGSRRGK